MNSITILWIRYYYYPHFNEEETETQRDAKATLCGPLSILVTRQPSVLLQDPWGIVENEGSGLEAREVHVQPSSLPPLLWSRPSHLVFPSLVALLYKSICLFYPKWFLKESTKIIVNPLKTVKLYTYIVNSWGMCRAASNRIADQQWFQQIRVDFFHTARSLEVGFWQYRQLSF